MSYINKLPMRWFLVLVITLFLFFLGSVANQASAQNDTNEDYTEEQHCFATISPVENGAEESEILDAQCFDNFAEAILVATEGAVSLPNDIDPGAVTEEILNTPQEGMELSGRIIGILYDYEEYGGSTLTWYGNRFGCLRGTWYYANKAPISWWDNRASSAKAFTGCYKWYQYEEINNNPYGAALVCYYCWSMRVMNNQASSWRWYNSGNHY